MMNDRFFGPLLLFLFALLLVGGTFFSSTRTLSSSVPSVDTTETKPLRLLMVGLAQDMARINTGLWHEEYDLIRQGASSIANHPKIPPEQMGKIKKALGGEFQNFVRFDKIVHGKATELVQAAEARDWSKVLTTYTQIRDGCVGCHTAYRDRLRPVLVPSK